MSVSSQKKSKSVGLDRKTILFNLSILTLFIKFIIIQNIQDGIWPGADAENYLAGLLGLNEEGIFSDEEKLTYWPAGYPIFIFLLAKISGFFLFPILSIIQSLLLAFAIYYLCKTILETRLKDYYLIIFIFISFNPTLALSSLTIGYESIAASGIIFSLALLIRDIKSNKSTSFKVYILSHSLIFGILSFFQPRLIVIGLFISIFWIFCKIHFRKLIGTFMLATLVMLLIPSTLILRNYQASGVATISTNLGNTMMLGVGDGASGGYLSPKGAGTPCNVDGDIAEQDRSLVKCALLWYLKNPGKSIELVFKKTIFFWSPWYGPAFNGTMARNPWLKINPIRAITATPDGAKLVFGDLGKLISYLWLALSLFLMFYGFLILWRLGGIERIFAITTGSVVFLAMATTWVTLGDNRFRVPIMGMSLLLQAVGIRTLFRGGKPPMVDGPALR